MAQNLAHFIFNSDYPMDKVVFYKQDEINVPTSGATLTVPHNLLFTPLPLVTVASNADFSDARDVYPLPVTVDATALKADATNITVTLSNSTSSAKKLYVRVYGLIPEGETREAMPTARQSSKLIFDTDKTYAPLIFSGRVTVTYDSTKVSNINVTNGYKELATTANRLEIEHNLGVRPYMALWQENSGVISYGSIVPAFQPGYPLQYYTYSEPDKCQVYTGLYPNNSITHVRIYANV